MDAESTAKSCLGIKMTLDELKKAYEIYIKEYPESREDPGEYDERFNETAFDESIYYNFMEILLKKYRLKCVDLNKYREEPIKLCICVWKRSTRTAWGNIQGTNLVECDFREIQQCIIVETKRLEEFMDECGLDHKLHKLKMFTIRSGSYY